MITRIVDSREPPQIREKLVQYGWDQQQMKIGDYKFSTANGKWVVIERKSVDDLISSFFTRLPRQMKNMGEAEDIHYPILLIEGGMGRVDKYIVGSNRNYYLNRMATFNFFQSCAWKWGIVRDASIDMNDTIERILSLMIYFQKPVHGTWERKIDPMGNPKLNVLTCIPNVGSSLAQRIWDRAGSVSELCSMSEEELTAIDGIGKQKAKVIYDFLH